MKKGVILELEKDKAVVMTGEVDFVIIRRRPEMRVGQQVDLSRMGADFPVKKCFWGLSAAAVCLSLTFLLIVPSYYRFVNRYAYITADINPGVEFVIDKDMRITGARPINEDGLRLRQGADFTNMTVAQALLMLADKAETAGYFAGERDRIILVCATIIKTTPTKPDKLRKSLEGVKAELASRKISVQYLQATLQQRKAALRNGISTGRYALMVYANSINNRINLKEAGGEDLFTLLDKAGMLEKVPEIKTRTEPTAGDIADHEPPISDSSRTLPSTQADAGSNGESSDAGDASSGEGVLGGDGVTGDTDLGGPGTGGNSGAGSTSLGGANSGGGRGR
ncbi:MAG: anti-sigma factor domain-containing protein [Bacillota bacterium]